MLLLFLLLLLLLFYLCITVIIYVQFLSVLCKLLCMCVLSCIQNSLCNCPLFSGFRVMLLFLEFPISCCVVFSYNYIVIILYKMNELIL